MPSIKKNFLYSSILTAANFLFPLITYPYVSRVLGVEYIGLCNFIDSIINYFILLSMLGVATLGIREIASCSNIKERSQSFFSLIAINAITTLIALFLLIVGIVCVPTLRENSNIMLVGAIKLSFNFLAIEWFYKGLEEFKYITARTLLVRVLYVISVFVIVKQKEDYLKYYMLTVGTIVLSSLINLFYAKNYLEFKQINIKIRAFLKPYLILGFYIVLTSMYTTFNTAYLGFIAGDTEVGYYSTSTKLFSIIIAIFTAYTGVMMPRMSSLLSKGLTDEFYSKISKSCELLIAIAIPTILFVEVLTPQIVFIVSGSGYEGAILPLRIIIPLVLIIGLEQILVIQTLMPLKRDKTITINSCIGALTGVLLNILLVQRFQAIGSAIVWVTCEMLIMILSFIALSNRIKFINTFKVLIKEICLNLPLLIILIVLNSCFNSSILIVFVGAGIFVISVITTHTVINKNSFCGQQIRAIFNKNIVGIWKK